VVVPLVLFFLNKPQKKETFKIIGDGSVVGDSANVNIDKRTGIDPIVYSDEVEKRVKAEIQLKQVKEEMQIYDVANHDELIRRYPFGYILFYIDRPNNVVIPYESRLKKECAIDLSETRVAYINDKVIKIELPTIQCQDGPTFHRCSWNIRREVGHQTRVFGHFLGIQMYLEMLIERGDSFVCVLGFANVDSNAQETK
jgi:hypothetical protein